MRERDSSRSPHTHTHTRTSRGVALFLRNGSREWRIKDFHSLPGGARAGKLGHHKPVWWEKMEKEGSVTLIDTLSLHACTQVLAHS